jgi:hypothetical protein
MPNENCGVSRMGRVVAPLCDPDMIAPFQVYPQQLHQASPEGGNRRRSGCDHQRLRCLVSPQCALPPCGQPAGCHFQRRFQPPAAMDKHCGMRTSSQSGGLAEGVWALPCLRRQTHPTYIQSAIKPHRSIPQRASVLECGRADARRKPASQLPLSWGEPDPLKRYAILGSTSTTSASTLPLPCRSSLQRPKRICPLVAPRRSARR